jgi:trimeric autotransporter adhesin
MVTPGSTSAAFPITATNYTSDFEATITAKDSVSTLSTELTVDSVYISSVTVSPATVTNGASALGTVTLSGPAPAGGWTIQLVSSEPDYAWVPISIAIPAGASTGTFNVTTGLSTVKFVFTLTITASHLSSSRVAALTLTP